MKQNKARYIIAHYDECTNQYITSTTKRYYKQTGLGIAYARSLETLTTLGGVQTYSTKQSANRAFKRDYDEIVQDCNKIYKIGG